MGTSAIKTIFAMANALPVELLVSQLILNIAIRLNASHSWNSTPSGGCNAKTRRLSYLVSVLPLLNRWLNRDLI